MYEYELCITMLQENSACSVHTHLSHVFSIMNYCPISFCRGAGPGCNSQEISDRLNELKVELENLDTIERILDEQKLWVQQSLKNVSEDPENEKHAYVSHEDLCKCYQGETLLAIQAPSGTQLEVPPPELVTTNLIL